jgi:acetyltransferase
MQYVRGWKMADGTAVSIRPVQWEDESLIVEFHQCLSAQTVHLRYFGVPALETRIGHEHLARICSSDDDREITLVVERIRLGWPQHQIIAVARLIKAPRANDAELAIVISDDWQGKGLGTKLLQDLFEIGRKEGLERLFGYVLSENYAMQHICRKLGCAMRYVASEDAFEVEMSLRGRPKLA